MKMGGMRFGCGGEDHAFLRWTNCGEVGQMLVSD
jgi:hypothetical protein